MSTIKVLARSCYDIQKLRIQMGNRVVMNFKSKLGQKPSEKEETLDKEEQNILKQLRASYKKLTDGVKTFPRAKTFKGDEVISTYTELSLLAQYIDLEATEAAQFKRLENALIEVPIYNHFLKDVKGIGPAMAGVIVSEIDIHKAEYPSSLHKYAGYDVVNGKGRRIALAKEQMEEIEYIDKDGNTQKKKTLGYNPFLKTKMYVAAGTLLKAGNEEYRKIYDDYKHRLENHPKHIEKTKGHRHMMAQRYMIKRFLSDLYNAWRPLENLVVAPSYEEAKLGMIHKKAA